MHEYFNFQDIQISHKWGEEEGQLRSFGQYNSVLLKSSFVLFSSGAAFQEEPGNGDGDDTAEEVDLLATTAAATQAQDGGGMPITETATTQPGIQITKSATDGKTAASWSVTSSAAVATERMTDEELTEASQPSYSTVTTVWTYCLSCNGTKDCSVMIETSSATEEDSVACPPGHACWVNNGDLTG